MKNAQQMINDIKNLLGIELSEDKPNETVEAVELATAKLENGAVIEAEAMSEGNDVFIVTDDEKVPLPDGTYTLESSEVLVAKDGKIVSIGEEKEEASAEVEAETDLEEEKKEDMRYATKEELAEVKKLVEEIKKMVEEKKEKMSKQEEENAELKEQLSEAAAKPIVHKPESKTELKKLLNINTQKNSTYSRVLANLEKFKN
tara:strand:- start:1070 stop:1675 length:606 start_codon:yes stop_codon:yes gene_type:complete